MSEAKRQRDSAGEANFRSKGVKRVRGVEPPFQPWQGSVITVILHPHESPDLRSRHLRRGPSEALG
jgi:hypothetical protein